MTPLNIFIYKFEFVSNVIFVASCWTRCSSLTTGVGKIFSKVGRLTTDFSRGHQKKFSCRAKNGEISFYQSRNYDINTFLRKS